MITHLLDTDICVYALKRRSRILAAALTAHDGRLAISEFTTFELHYGAQAYDDPSKRIALIEDFSARFEIAPFDGKSARHAGEIRASLESSGRMIGAYDVLIAGVARANGLVLVTNNTREFARVDGLRLEKWV